MIVFTMGWETGAGKTTNCIVLLHALMHAGYPASMLSYVKPVTKCEHPTDVVAFCSDAGIKCVSIGPVVFRPGITQNTISCGKDGYNEACNALLRSAEDAVMELAGSYQVVVIDGLGYPSTGSCCGVSLPELLASVLKRLEGKHTVRVVFVAPSGLGDPLDRLDAFIVYCGHHLMRRGVSLPQDLLIGMVCNRADDTERHRVAESEGYIQSFLGMKAASDKVECYDELYLRTKLVCSVPPLGAGISSLNAEVTMRISSFLKC